MDCEGPRFAAHPIETLGVRSVPIRREGDGVRAWLDVDGRGKGGHTHRDTVDVDLCAARLVDIELRRLRIEHHRLGVDRASAEIDRRSHRGIARRGDYEHVLSGSHHDERRKPSAALPSMRTVAFEMGEKTASRVLLDSRSACARVVVDGQRSELGLELLQRPRGVDRVITLRRSVSITTIARDRLLQIDWARFESVMLSIGLGDCEEESFQRKSRMVEISLSGSGEGLGRAIPRGYSAAPMGSPL